jgi:hypothetical protein
VCDKRVEEHTLPQDLLQWIFGFGFLIPFFRLACFSIAAWSTTAKSSVKRWALE